MKPSALLTIMLALTGLIAPLAAWAASPVTIENAGLCLVDEAEATSLAAGAVVSMHAKEGDLVRRGQVLATLDETEQNIAVATALVEARIARHAAEQDVSVRFANKSADAARAELRRSEESVARFAKSVSRSQLDVERLAIERAELEAEKAEHDRQSAALEAERAEQRLAAAEQLLVQRRIVAPLDGMVIEAPIRRGEWVEPGQSVFRIVATHRLKAEGYLNVESANQIAVDWLVCVSSSTDEAAREARGRIILVSPVVDPVTAQVRVVAEINNEEEAFRPGERVLLTVLDEEENSPAETNQRTATKESSP
ncbi:efflux RND transporter periplasmic adaptor subunit [Botrimarina hoheduenensis]|uniref:Multidrug resistance protein MdtA n=1 Tax=Botrimarina hoheduenensis TaxID=2528000 RepID=A0A5C5VZF2_9BACT|nr:HlyD family efflux transporter periplasmic adaptor subunit [Botrimarina hoheduenensis]TWT43353.1 Multidrug resistance protein MdtA precursor [Botrimarina hoheduenensis]